MNDLNLAFRVVCAVAALEALAVVVLVGVVVHLYRSFTVSQKELLDRLMSRNLQEYVSLSPAAARQHVKKRTLSDEEMAEQEDRHREVRA